ncbi:MAG: hypothetical protein AAGH99_00875 [Planctomycetota bacterium]
MLFDPSDPGERRYAEHRKLFSSAHEAIVLIDTGEYGESEASASAAAFALGEALEDENKIAAVYWGLDPTAVSPKLARTLPADELAVQVERMLQLQPLIESPNLETMLQAGMAEAMSGGAGGSSTPSSDLAEGARVFVAIIEAIKQRLQTPANEPVDLWSAMIGAAGGLDWQLLRSASGRLLVLRVELLEAADDEPGYGGSLAALRRQVETVRLRFPDVEMGVTGFEPTKREAEAVMRGASMRAAGGAALALLLLSGLAWRSVWLPGVVVIVTAAGVCWTLGLTGWVFGEVGRATAYGLIGAMVLSALGGLILAGVLARGDDVKSAVRITGPVIVVAGLVIGAVGVVLVALGGNLPGGADDAVRLIGLREAGGVLLIGVIASWIATLALAPALLPEARPKKNSRSESRGELALGVGVLSARHPGWAWSVAGLIVLAVGAWAWRTPNSFELTGWTPRETEGAVWQRRALVQGGEWGLLLQIVAEDMDEAAALTRRLRETPEVGGVSGIARLIPVDPAEVDTLLQPLEKEIGAAAREEASMNAESTTASLSNGSGLINQVRLVRTALGFLPAGVREQLGGLDATMIDAADELLAVTEALPDSEREARLVSLARDYTAARQQAGLLVSGVLDPTPLTPYELTGAAGLFDAWIAWPDGKPRVGGDAKLLLKLFPDVETPGAATTTELLKFRRAALAVDSNATGALERLIARGDRLVWAVWTVGVGVILSWLLIAWAFGVGWRGCLGGAVALAGSGVVLCAGVGVLGEPMTPLAWLVWPAVGMIAVGWASVCALSVDVKDPHAARRRAAGAEAFGLILAVGFVIAAGLRSALADGLTATAVAACVAIGLAGLWGLMLVNRQTSASRAER